MSQVSENLAARLHGRSGGLRELLAAARVVPVFAPPEPDRAVRLVEALLEGGLGTVEVTLRTPSALDAVRRVTESLPEAIVGVGSVVRAEQVLAARDAGARFVVSPGLTGDLAAAVRRVGVPWMPGVATVSEAMMAHDAGFEVLKLFPASTVGGVAFLDAIRGPLPEILFCPTGGLDRESWRAYLERENVVAVGGSWMIPSDAVRTGDWDAVAATARELAG